MIETKPNKLNEAQLTVLSMLSGSYSDTDVLELRAILAEFNNQKLLREIELSSKDKNFSQADFENMAKGHLRRKAT